MSKRPRQRKFDRPRKSGMDWAKTRKAGAKQDLGVVGSPAPLHRSTFELEQALRRELAAYRAACRNGQNTSEHAARAQRLAAQLENRSSHGKSPTEP